MPSGQVFVIAALAAMAYWGLHKAAEGVRKVDRQIICVAKTGHKCPKPTVHVDPAK